MKFYLSKVSYLLFGILLLSFNAFSSTFEETAANLLVKSNKKKAEVINTLASIQDPRVLPTLSALLDAKLYFVKASDQLIFIQTNEDKFLTTDVFTGEDAGEMAKQEIKKIRINNKLRRLLRSKIAVLELTSEDESLRLKSAKNIAKKPDASIRELIASSIKNESSAAVVEALELALALIDINGENQELRLNAIQVLGRSVEPQAVGALNKLIEQDEQEQYLEQNTEVIEKAEKTLKTVNSKLGFFKFTENLLFGISLGSILLLAAIGLAITFGVMGVINMAHGEMIMLGAYTTFAVQQIFPSMVNESLFIAIPAAFLVAGTVGILIERLVIRHLYGRPLDTLLATFGISLILQQAIRMYSSNSVSVISPEWISGAWQINGAISLTYNRIYILIFSLIVLGVLALILKKTLIGLQMRAVTQNRAMANSMGIKSSWVDALTFGLGSGIAGIAGVALSQIDSVSPNLGQTYIVDTFMVVVFGGVGNILGTFFGALSLGVVNKFLEPYTGAVIGKIMVLVFIILFIQWRPRGLFALKGRFVED